MSEFRFTANAVRERARVQYESGVLDAKQHETIITNTGTAERVATDFTDDVANAHQTYRPELVPERIAAAAAKARQALRPVEAARDAAIREAADYAEHVSGIERNPDGVTFRPRRPDAEPSALDLARLSFLWSRLAGMDPGDARRVYATECAKGEQADRLFLKACETYPVPGLLDEDTKRIARDARVRALGLTSYQQARDSVAAALTLVVDAAHAVVNAAAGGAVGMIRRASDDASIDVRIA